MLRPLPPTQFATSNNKNENEVVLTRDTSRDNNDIRAGERLLHAIVGGEETLNAGNSRDVGEVGGDTGSVDDIVEGEVVDERARLEEEGQWLSDAAGGTCYDCVVDTLVSIVFPVFWTRNAVGGVMDVAYRPSYCLMWLFGWW